MNNVKKILMLGGSAAQVPAIKKAKELGLYTIVCDYLKDNPGQYFTDKYYEESTTDIERILKIADTEKIDGILAYGSDPAAPTAAYVAEKLNLPGIPYETAKIFCNKNLFREFLMEKGFHYPKTITVHEPNEIINTDGLNFPLIIKPTDSSGSKGISIIKAQSDIAKAVNFAFEKSRSGTVVIEEYIERDHEHVIEAEIFIEEGKVSSWGLFNSIRDNKTNPLLPAAYSYPLKLDNQRINLVKNELNKLIHSSNIVYGACNIEMIITNNNQLYFLDAGPRNGGNQLPEYVELISGKNLIESTIYAALGEYKKINASFNNSTKFIGLGVLHSNEKGHFKSVMYSDMAKKALISENININPGDLVNPFQTCVDLIGLTFFEFDNINDMNEVMENPYRHMKVELA